MEPKKMIQIIAFLVALALGTFLILPFVNAIIFAAVFAYILYPVHDQLQKHITKNVSAGVMTSLLAVGSVVFIFLSIRFLINEFSNIYVVISQINFTSFFEGSALALNLKDLIRILLSKFLESFSELVTQLPQLVISFFIFLMSFFYFLRDGKKAWLILKKNLPLISNRKQLWKDIERYFHTFVYIWLVIGVLQGLTAGFGFYIFKLPYPIVAGLAAAFLSIVPILGPYLVYIPIGIITIVNGDLFTGLGILAYGIIIGSILDYVLRPYFAGRWSSIHPIIVLIGIFGGLLALGPVGIIMGPIIFLIAISILKSFGSNFFGGKKK